MQRKIGTQQSPFRRGDSKGIRTPVAGVRGRSLNRLTMEPKLVAVTGFEPVTLRVWTVCSSQLSYTAIYVNSRGHKRYSNRILKACQDFFAKNFIFLLFQFLYRGITIHTTHSFFHRDKGLETMNTAIIPSFPQGVVHSYPSFEVDIPWKFC